MKTGFRVPPDLETKLAAHVPWGTKQRIVEGLLRLLITELEQGSYTLWHRALEAYHTARAKRK